MKEPLVLVIGASTDPNVDSVASALSARGARLVRFDTDAFPSAGSLALGESSATSFVASADGEVSLHGLEAVWSRPMDTARDLPRAMEPAVRACCVESAEIAVQALLDSLDVFHLDPFRLVRDGDHKPRQLAIARSLGLATPRTLIANEASAVRAFARTCVDGIVTKMIVPMPRIGEDVDAPRVYTRALSASDLESLEGLETCPMLFQERIAKTADLRVTVVGRRVFAAAVDSQRSDATALDWRRDQESLFEAWKPYALDAAVERKLLALMDRLGLEYGAADFVLDRDGRAVFLEVNVQGDFSFVEANTELPIASAVADVLLDPNARRGRKS